MNFWNIFIQINLCVRYPGEIKNGTFVKKKVTKVWASQVHTLKFWDTLYISELKFVNKRMFLWLVHPIRAASGELHFTPFLGKMFYRFLDIKQSTPLCIQKYRIFKNVGIPNNFRYTDYAGSPAPYILPSPRPHSIILKSQTLHKFRDFQVASSCL